MEDIKKIAKKHITDFGFDSIYYKGEKNLCHYFMAFNKANLGRYIGLPYVIKINSQKEIFVVRELKEKMWAINAKGELF